MNTGGPAFPGGITSQLKATDDCPPTQIGMSLRDWLAGMALQGVKLQALGPIRDNEELRAMADQIATGAYAIADAMIRHGQTKL